MRKVRRTNYRDSLFSYRFAKVWIEPLARMSGTLVSQLVFDSLRTVWMTTLRESLFFLWIFNDFEGAAGPDVGNVSFPIGF